MNCAAFQMVLNVSIQMKSLALSITTIHSIAYKIKTHDVTALYPDDVAEAERFVRRLMRRRAFDLESYPHVFACGVSPLAHCRSFPLKKSGHQGGVIPKRRAKRAGAGFTPSSASLSPPPPAVRVIFRTGRRGAPRVRALRRSRFGGRACPRLGRGFGGRGADQAA